MTNVNKEQQQKTFDAIMQWIANDANTDTHFNLCRDVARDHSERGTLTPDQFDTLIVAIDDRQLLPSQRTHIIRDTPARTIVDAAPRRSDQFSDDVHFNPLDHEQTK